LDFFVVINPSIDFNNRVFDEDECLNRCFGNFNKLMIGFDFDDDDTDEDR
jgi:hypothetical protein